MTRTHQVILTLKRPRPAGGEPYPLPCNLVVAGVGGQGNVLASQLIAWAAINEGLHATIGETYGASQRGGPVMSHIRFGQQKLGPLVPRHQAQVLLGFEPLETLRVGALYLNSDSTVIMNTRPVWPTSVLQGQAPYPDLHEFEERLRELCCQLITLEAVELARQAGSLMAANMVMVGALAGSGLTPLPVEAFRAVVEAKVPRQVEVNLAAFDLGVAALTKEN